MESSIAEFLLRQVACEHLPTPAISVHGAAACGFLQESYRTWEAVEVQHWRRLANLRSYSVLQAVTLRGAQLFAQALRV